MRGFVRDNAAFLSAGALLTFSSSFGQTFFISIFSGEIRSALDLSHGAWGTIYSAGTCAAAVAMIWVGQLTDVMRVRALSMLVLPVFALACLMMATVSSVAVLVVTVFLLRLAGQGMATHIATVAIARWFVATRGRALSVAMLGFAMGEALLPLTFVALLSLFDWRWLWVMAAGLVMTLLPILFRLLALERTPQSVAEDTQSEGMDGRHWRRADVLGHWLFWAMVPFMLGPPTFATAFFFHQVHVAETKDMSHLALVALFPLYTGCAVLTMLGSGFVIDRIGTARLMPLCQLPIVAGFLVMSVATGPVGAAIGMVLMALTVGMLHTLPAAFWAEFYGTRYIGAVKAMAAAVMVLGTAVGPIATGILIDAGVTFDTQMVGIAIYFLAASLCTALAIARAAPLLPLRV